jgi:hypothetical protein
MKKYNWYWSIWNAGKATQEPVVKLQKTWLTVIGIVAGSTWAVSNADYALIVAIVGALVNEAIGCIYLEEKQ